MYHLPFFRLSVQPVMFLLLFLISASLSAQQPDDCACKYTRSVYFADIQPDDMTTRPFPLMNSSLKSERKATLLSLLGTTLPTAASIYFLSKHDVTESYPNTSIYYDTKKERNSTIGGILLFTGLYIGPSMGHFYAERPMRGLGGFGLRTGISLATVTGAWAACPWDCSEGDDGYELATGILIVGSAAMLGSIVYDIAAADNSVRKHNAQVARKISVQPTFAYREKTVGLSISVHL